jgi:aminoglycoside 6'-N-acetyltransferase I
MPHSTYEAAAANTPFRMPPILAVGAAIVDFERTAVSREGPAMATRDDAAQIRVLGPGDADALTRVAPGVFDGPIIEALALEFLNDRRHHLAVALDAGCVVGMASALHYVHPDKGPEMWVNEVAVTVTHRRRGIGTALLHALFDVGRDLGCIQAWVLTDSDNRAARRLYAGVGGEAEAATMVSFRIDRR